MHKSAFLLILVLFYMVNQSTAQSNAPNDLLQRLMVLEGDKYEYYLNNYKKHQIQIIYTQIQRDKAGNPTFQHFTFNIDPSSYIYPASLVKLPTAMLAMEKANKIKEINKYMRISNLPSRFCKEFAYGNNPKDINPPTLAKYIEQMMLISDNNAYSKLYEFLGQAYIYENLTPVLPNARIVKRFSSCISSEVSKYTNAVVFYNDSCQVVYQQKEEFNENFPKPPFQKKIGKAYINEVGQFVKEPMDCSTQNFLSLKSVHELLMELFFKNSVFQKFFYLSDDDRRFLMRSLGAYPHEGIYNTYIPQVYHYAHKKYLYYGQSPAKPINKQLRIFNTVGLAYGYVSDCAYFVDADNHIEFFLSASIYVNENEVINDNRYEYPLGFEFLKRLGVTIYNYERTLYKANLYSSLSTPFVKD